MLFLLMEFMEHVDRSLGTTVGRDQSWRRGAVIGYRGSVAGAGGSLRGQPPRSRQASCSLRALPAVRSSAWMRPPAGVPRSRRRMPKVVDLPEQDVLSGARAPRVWVDFALRDSLGGGRPPRRDRAPPRRWTTRREDRSSAGRRAGGRQERNFRWNAGTSVSWRAEVCAWSRTVECERLRG